jgi:Ni/Fe-hydrogenase 1 B-type cytochrome subunit
MPVQNTTLEPVYVYQVPIRLWHWINAASIVVLAVTGYLIASPLPSIGGEASEHFLMGYIRFAHFAAGYIFAIGLLVRIYWGIVGNEHSREIFMPPLLSKDWWAGMWFHIRWYAFLEKEPKKYIGHNPLALLAMFFYMLMSTFMLFTGFALYSEGTGLGSWQSNLFGWVIPFLGSSQEVHTWHHLGMWGIIIFVMIHMYIAIREDIMARTTMISTMVNGWRFFKDTRP